MDLGTLTSKVNLYKEILENTKSYRADWVEKVIPLLQNTLGKINEATELGAKVEIKDEMENLAVVVFSLGQQYSGIAEKLEDSDAKRSMIKSNGSLVFQQLFNGKILIMIMYPFIEGYGQPRPPKTVEILRPHELTEPFIIRYIETFMKEIIEWEDYDDDAPQQGQMPTIGFQSSLIMDDEQD